MECPWWGFFCVYMKENISKRRFREAVDGAFIRQNYATMQNAELARMMGMTVKQVENYVYRCGKEDWARKQPALLSLINSENGKRGGRPQKLMKK